MGKGIRCRLGLHKWLVDISDWAHIAYCYRCDDVDWPDVKFSKIKMEEEIS
jgi:hypothetical protein